MADRLSDGQPNEQTKALRLAELKVDLHGLQHQRMRYQLEIQRWEDNIRKHGETIAATSERIAELSQEIKELEHG